MSLIHRLVCAVLVLALSGTLPARAQTAEPPSSSRLLATAKSWGYQLQNIDPDVIAGAPYDVFVIDYSRDGGDASALTPDEVKRLQLKPDGSRRIVLSYLSIGEAET